jgi:hypothetical protein
MSVGRATDGTSLNGCGDTMFVYEMAFGGKGLDDESCSMHEACYGLRAPELE